MIHWYQSLSFTVTKDLLRSLTWNRTEEDIFDAILFRIDHLANRNHLLYMSASDMPIVFCDFPIKEGYIFEPPKWPCDLVVQRLFVTLSLSHDSWGWLDTLVRCSIIWENRMTLTLRIYTYKCDIWCFCLVLNCLFLRKKCLFKIFLRQKSSKLVLVSEPKAMKSYTWSNILRL